MNTLGYIGSLLLAFCALPETLRSYRTKTCSIGWGMLLMWLVGEILTLVYVVWKSSEVSLVPLLANYSVNIAMIVIMCYYKGVGNAKK